MKATILSYIGFFLITIQLVVLGTLIAKSSYQQTIEQSVEESMDLAANMLKEGYAANREINMELLKTKGYVPDETTLSWSSSGLSDWKKEFVNYLSRNIDSRITDLSVNLYAADESKGILSAEATVTYKYLNGRIGTATCYKTIVLNTDGETSFDADDSGLPVASVSVAPQAKNLTYNGKEQTLVNKGFSETGTIFYKLEETGVFSKTPPTAIDAGNYTVYYIVRGDGEHTNSGIYSVPVTINKATPSYQAPKAKTLTYNGTSQTLLQAGSVGNKCKIQYRLGDSGSWTDTIPSAKNAGSFDVYYRIKGTNNYKDIDPVKITVTIDLAKPTVKTNAAAKTGLIYNGAAQELITGGSATNGTLKYSLTKDGTYSASVPKGTNAGSYTVYMKIFGDANYDTVDAGSIKVTIAKKKLIASIPSGKSLTYTGSAQELITAGNTVTGGQMQYMVINNGNADATQTSFKSSIPTGTNAGTYIVSYKAVATNSNYEDSDAGTVNVVIKPAAVKYTKPVILDGTFVYNGKDQVLTTVPAAEGGSIWYGVSSSAGNTPGSSSTKGAVAKNAGTYYIWYNVAADANHISEKWTLLGVKKIEKASSAMKTLPTEKTGLVYDGSYQALLNAGTAESGVDILYSLDNNSYSKDIPAKQDAGTYTVYAKIDASANYKATDPIAFSVTIAKATPTFITAPAGKTLSYSGSEQELVSAGRVTGGSLQYKISGGNYSTSIPKATYVGSYTVYYKVVGNKNWNDVTERSVTSYITDSVKPQISKATSVASSNFTNIGYGQGINMSLPDSSCHWARYMSLTYTFTVSDNVGVTGYYWGGVNPTNVNSVSWTAVSGNTITKTLNYPDSGTYYFAVRDGAGNIASVSCTAEFGERMMNQSSGSITNTKRLSKFAVNNCSGAPYISSSFDGHEATSNTGPVLYNVNGANANYTQSGTRTSCFLTYIFYD